jgi:hypothetical protein
MHDRRKLTRWCTNKEAKLKLEGAESFIEAHLLDINFRGIQISLRPKLPKDTTLKFKLVLAGGFELHVEGWIVWHRTINGHNIYGIYFTKLTDHDKEKIYKFVYQHAPHEISKLWWKDAAKKEKGGEIMEDRRVFERFSVEFPMRYLDLTSGREGQARTCDISAKGVGLVADRELATRTPVEVWLQIPDRGEPLYTRGEIAWARKTEANVWRAGINLEKADLMGLSRVLREPSFKKIS